MKKIFSKWLPCATLTAWSAILLYFYFSGRIKDLLHPTFRPFTLITGIVLLIIAVCFAVFPVSVQECLDEDLAARSFGRRTSGRILTFLILLVPICAAAAFSSNSYGLSTVLNRGIVDDASGLGRQPTQTKATPYEEPPLPTNSDSPTAQSQPAPGPQTAQQNTQPPPAADDEIPRTKDGHIIVQVVDLLYAAQDPTMRDPLKSQTIEMIGQLMPDNEHNASGKRFKLVRMFMVCCAADARPVAVLCESDTKPAGEDMSWIKIVGKVEFPIENGRPVAVVKATKVIPTDPPEETMLY